MKATSYKILIKETNETLEFQQIPWQESHKNNDRSIDYLSLLQFTLRFSKTLSSSSVGLSGGAGNTVGPWLFLQWQKDEG